MTTRTCKTHNHLHFYTRCNACGLEFCPHTFATCPRCYVAAQAHAAYWAQCPDCEQRVRELLAQDMSNGDAQGIAEAEHMRAQHP